MKKYIREMLDDLKKKNAPAPVVHYDTPPVPPVPEDLENQELSSDADEEVRQLDFQAQESEQEQTS